MGKYGKFSNIIAKQGTQKSRIWETLNLLTDADSSTNTKTNTDGQKEQFLVSIKKKLGLVRLRNFGTFLERGSGWIIIIIIFIDFFSSHQKTFIG